MLGFQQFSPPSDEGGAEGRGGGREKRDKSINKAFFDYPQSPITLKKVSPSVCDADSSLVRGSQMRPQLLQKNLIIINISEFARVCDMSRTTIYKYLSLLEK